MMPGLLHVAYAVGNVRPQCDDLRHVVVLLGLDACGKKQTVKNRVRK